MTIPTLVANYQEKSWGTAATVFERKLTEALKVMNVQGTLAGYQTTESFVEELSKHFKTTKICTNDKLQDCFSSEVTYGNEVVDMTKVKTAKHFGQDEWGTEIIGTQFANGTTALIAYNPACSQDPYSNQITGGDCLAILYDTTGYKTPNTSGKDLRANGNVTKVGGSSCAFEIDGTCFATMPFPPSPVSKEECEAMISTHGIAACNYSNDYWAGAVKACGHVNNLPTKQQLADLGEYLYPRISSIGTSGTSYCPGNATCREDNNALSVGFTGANSSTALYVWSKDEYNSSYSYYISFAPPLVHWYGEETGWGRSSESQLAICVHN